MAISYIGGWSNYYNATQDYITPTIHASATTGDFMIALVMSSENIAARLWDDDGGGTNGWTLWGQNRTTSGRDMETAIYYKIHDGSESNPTFTIGGGSNEPIVGCLLVFRGVDSIAPLGDIVYNFQVNTPNPTNPAVDTDYDNAWVLIWQSATHDDITGDSVPTGYTARETVSVEPLDHMYLFTATKSVATAGTETPAAWGHTTANSTPESQCYTIVLNEAFPVHITDPETGDPFLWSDTNVTITGDGFEATQGTGGKVELWSDTSGTTKVSQSVDSWSATSIQIDFSQGTLTDGANYLVVTNDSAEESNLVLLSMGFGPYEPNLLMQEQPDHYWKMNNSYDDDGLDGTLAFNAANSGTGHGFVATPICRTNTHSFQINARTEYVEPGDSEWMNITNAHERRRVGGWLRLESAQTLPGVVFEEGGGVNNIYFVTGYGSKLFANIEDDGDFAVQAFGDKALTLGRPYHILCAFDGSGDGNEFYLLIDGVKQSVTSGNPPANTSLVSHSGNMTFGDPQQNLQTGGQDIAYQACDDMLLAHWGSWCKIGGGIPTDTEIRDELFRKGALADDTISADTQANMQTDLEDYDSSTRPDWPLSFDIEDVTGGGDLELTATDMVFDEGITLHARWLGGGELIWRNSGTSNFDSTKVHLPGGGTVSVIETAPVKITTKDATTGATITGARIRILAATGGPLPFEDSVSITRSGTTATVTHTAHGMLDGVEVSIDGATQEEYNGIYTITNVATNSYDYTLSGTPATPATGSPEATAVVLTGVSDGSGELETEIDYTSSQPISGIARKGSATPYYQEAAIIGTIGASGFDGTAFLVRDE